MKIKDAWVDLLGEVPWAHWVTLTTRFRLAPHLFTERVSRWIEAVSAMLPKAISWVLVVEDNASGRPHGHLLTAGTKELSTSDMRRPWRSGVSRVDRHDPTRNAIGYMARKLAEPGIDFDLDLNPHQGRDPLQDTNQEREEAEPVKIRAWIQMGCERREVAFDVEELGRGAPTPENFESAIEELVLEWIGCRFGWGWTGGGFENDFTFMEDTDSGTRDVEDIMNARTVRTPVVR